MIAYKVANSESMCRDLKIVVGNEYSVEGDLVLCKNGLHFCRKLSNCFSYYNFNNENKVFEIEVLGDIIGDPEEKECSNKIKIIRELTWEECIRLCNSGDSNSGNRNSGNRNSGDSNSGDSNSGNWNSGNWNSGYFNSTNNDRIRVFNVWIDDRKIEFPRWFYFDLVSFVSHDTATDEEKEKYKKEIEVCGGFLKTLDYREAWKLSYEKVKDNKKELLKAINLPNFDYDVFEEIAGIDLKYLKGE